MLTTRLLFAFWALLVLGAVYAARRAAVPRLIIAGLIAAGASIPVAMICAEVASNG